MTVAGRPPARQLSVHRAAGADVEGLPCNVPSPVRNQEGARLADVFGRDLAPKRVLFRSAFQKKLPVGKRRRIWIGHLQLAHQLVSERRPHKSGRDGIYVDVGLGQSERVRLGYVDGRGLRSRVMRDYAASEPSRDRSDVHDFPLTPLLHMRFHRLRRVDDAESVDGEHRIPVIIRELSPLRPTWRCAHTGVVDQDVYPAEAVQRGLRHRVRRRLAGYIRPDEDRLTAKRLDLARYFAAARLIEVGDDDARAACGEFKCDAAADAVAAPSYDGDLACEFLRRIGRPRCLASGP